MKIFIPILLIISISLAVEVEHTHADHNRTTIEMGDAIYNNGGSYPFCAGQQSYHWHAGIFCGFNIVQGVAIFQGAEHGPDDAQRIFTGSYQIESDLGLVVNAFNDCFENKFAEENDISYAGAFSPNYYLSPTEREDIVIQAKEFVLYSEIDWYWGSLIDPVDHWFEDGAIWYEDWQGTLADIEDARCDAIVEWAYEKNNHRVWANDNEPEDLWNVTLPGNDYVDAHGNVHLCGFSYGYEMCPRSQSEHMEDHCGGNTTMQDTKENLPFISRVIFQDGQLVPQENGNFRVLNVTGAPGGGEHDYVTIDAFLGDKESLCLYLLLQVRLKGKGEWETAFFYDKQDLWHYSSSKQYQYAWLLKDWDGKTKEGSDYNFATIYDADSFEYRFTVIDRGGNYISQEWPPGAVGIQKTMPIIFPIQIR